jgi:hypothetical protein
MSDDAPEREPMRPSSSSPPPTCEAEELCPAEQRPRRGSARRRGSMARASSDDARPEVRIEPGRSHASANAALAALAETRSVFRRGGEVVHVPHFEPDPWEQHAASVGASGEHPVLSIARGTPVIRVMRPGVMGYDLARHVRFTRWRKIPEREGGGGEWVPVDCPAPLATMVQHVGAGQILPSLAGILRGPAIRPDGSIISEYGYDDATGYFLGAPLPLQVPETPTLEDARRSLAALQELFAPPSAEYNGFPWVHGAADTIVPIALVLTLVARPAINGTTPAFAIDASTAGSGKGKVIDIASIIATGGPASKASWSENAEEREKVIGSYALLAPPLIAWDNVRSDNPIESESLEGALTSRTYAFRVLGHSQVLELAWRSVATFTGNNMTIDGDMHRRCLWVRLEPDREHPERNRPDEYRHPYVETHVEAHRGVYIGHVLTILRGYVLAGMPDQGVHVQSFDSWSRLIAGALKWAGAGDISKWLATDMATDPPEKVALHTLATQWQRLAPKGDTVGAVLSHLYSGDYLEAARKGQTEKFDADAGDREARQAIEAICPAQPGQRPSAQRVGKVIGCARAQWLDGRRFMHVIGPTGKPTSPVKWKVESRGEATRQPLSPAPEPEPEKPAPRGPNGCRCKRNTNCPCTPCRRSGHCTHADCFPYADHYAHPRPDYHCDGSCYD